jgi:cell division protein FtsA
MAKPPIITGLDIGSGTVKILVAQKKPKEEDLEVLAISEEISSGVRKGVVINPNEVAGLIQQVIKKTEEQINRKINSVYVNVGGSHIFSTSSRGLVSVSRADQKISAEDIERVLQAAQTFSLPSNREILEVFPKEFIIDGEKGLKEVLGLQGVRLEAEVLVLGGFAPYLKNLTTAVLNSGLQINDLIFSPLASSRAVLTPREKELGVALLDIGAGTTGLAVFEEGNLIHLTILPIGSGHITNDIAIGLKTDIDIAERIKLEFGTLFFQGSNKKEKIKLAEGETLVFSQKQLSKIIEDRVSEIFGEINKELKKISRQQSLPAGIVLTGGGAKLPKIKELAKKEFRLNCRLGLAKGFSPPPDDPRLSTVCGLVLREADLEEEKTGWKEGFSISGKGIGAKIKRIFRIFLP